MNEIENQVDVILVTAFFSISGAVIFAIWVRRVATLRRWPSGNRSRWSLSLAPVVGFGIYTFAIARWSSSDVVGPYVAFYLALGFLILSLTTLGPRLFGVSCLYDAIERNNASAAWAFAGGQLAVMIIAAGANIGDGPGPQVVFFSTGLACLGLWFLWITSDFFCEVTEAITVDRDLATGIRQFGLFVAAGLILGRAVAGNWTSYSDTVHDFLYESWPAAILFVIAMLLHGLLKPSPREPIPSVATGIFPATIYAVIAATHLYWRGWWQ